MNLSHTDTESTNKQHSLVQFNKGDVTLIWLDMEKHYRIQININISVCMCPYMCMTLLLFSFYAMSTWI